VYKVIVMNSQVGNCRLDWAAMLNIEDGACGLLLVCTDQLLFMHYVCCG